MDDIKAVFEQFHVPSPRGSHYDLLRKIEQKTDEYAIIHAKEEQIGSFSSANRDFSKAAFEMKAKAELAEAERESRLEDILRVRKEREDRFLAIELERERKAEEMRLARKTHWEKIIEKLKVPPPSSDYYQKTPFKPGFLFLDGLVRAPKVRLQELRLNIPHTLYFTTEIVQIYTDAMGRVVCDDRASALEFLKLIEKTKKEGSHPFDGIAVVLRGRGEMEHQMSKHLIDWVTFRHKIASHDFSQYSMMQQFIKSPGGKAASIRLSYHPQSKDNKANSAFFLSSLVQTASFMSPAELLQRCVIDLNYVDSFEIFKMTGPAIREVEMQAKGIVGYVSRAYGVRILRIDLDFLKDESGRLWLCGCRGFLLDSAVSLNMQLLPKEIRQETMAERKKGSFVICKLCRLQYPNYELSHLIAVRMLVVFKKHLSRRTDFPVDMSHIKVVTNDVLSQSVRVCDLCFMLITAEFQLISTERSLALATSIPYQEESIEDNIKHEMQLQFLPKALLQWRVLIYFRYFTSNNSLLQQYENLKFSLEFADSKTDFEVKKNVLRIEKEIIEIERLKMFYFFSEGNKPPNDFLRNSKAKINLFNSSNLIAKGEFPVFSDFSRGVPINTALFQKKLVSVFPLPYSTSFPITVIVGLSCDHQVAASHLKTELRREYDAYLPEEFYCNGDPLPTAWMEIFQDVKEEISFGEEPTLKDAYYSTLTPMELRRMEDISSSSRSLAGPLSGPKPPHSSRPISAILPRNKTEATLGDSSALDYRTQDSIKDVFHTVHQFLRERPLSAVLKTDTSGSILRPKSTRKKLVRVTSAASSRLHSAKTRPTTASTRLASPLSRQLTFTEQFREISHRVSLDMRSFGLTSPTNDLLTEP